MLKLSFKDELPSLWHFTKPKYLPHIVGKDQLGGWYDMPEGFEKDESWPVSLTRNRGLQWTPGQAALEFDRDKLHQHYKLTPYNFEQRPRSFSTHNEAEERTPGPIKGLNNYLKHIYVTEGQWRNLATELTKGHDKMKADPTFNTPANQQYYNSINQ